MPGLRGLRLAALGALSAALGCADVTVSRIHEGNRNSAQGFRYYLPRPYVVVKQSFPVAGEDRIVYGEVDAERQIVSVDLPDMPGFSRSAGRPEVPLASIRPPLRASHSPRRRGHATLQAGGGASPPAAGGESALGTTRAEEALLAGSQSSRAILAAADPSFQITLVLGEGAGWASVTKPEVGLVPWAVGQSEAKRFVPLIPLALPAYTKGKSYTLTAVGSRDHVAPGTTYVIALRFVGKLNEADAEQVFTVHRTVPSLHVTSQAGSASEGTKAGPDEGLEVVSEAGLTTMGDPQTNPHLSLNQHFDVLYLPDMDEQYAVCVKGGIGLANAAVGLENGWMMERASIRIDNRELGRFILRNAEKFIDIAADIAGAELVPSGGDAAASESAKDQAILQAGGARRKVALRVRYVREATPGVYPILKQSEYETWKGACAAGPDYVLLPYPPFTVVAFNVVNRVLIELVSGAGSVEQAPDAELTAGELIQVRAVLNRAASDLAEGDRAALAQLASGAVEPDQDAGSATVVLRGPDTAVTKLLAESAKKFRNAVAEHLAMQNGGLTLRGRRVRTVHYASQSK